MKTTRTGLRALMGLMVFSLSLTGAAEADLDGPPKPNLVWICLDAARATNFSCYGYDRPTSPTIDALAAQGALMENNFSQATWTAPSVASYMTGRYFPVFSHQPMAQAAIYREPPPEEQMIPRIMAANGYETVFVTTHFWWPETSRLYKSFDQSLVIEATKHKQWVPAGFDVINERLSPVLDALAAKPFFLYIHAMDTHFPHVLQTPHDQWTVPGYESAQMGFGQPKEEMGSQFSAEDIHHLRGLYDGGIHFADAQIGVLMEKFRDLGLFDNTIFIIGSDHGELLGEDGTTWAHSAHAAPDRLIHVPLVMFGPGIPKGRRISHLTQNADIAPTLVDLLGLETSASFDGASLAPLLSSAADKPIHASVFSKWFEYEDPECLLLRSQSLRFEYNPITRADKLVSVPSNALDPPNIAGERPAEAKTLRAHLEEHVLPGYEAYKGLPNTAFDFYLYQSIEEIASPSDAFVIEMQGVSDPARHDGLWSFSRPWQCLWASFEETVPPLQVTLDVPDGDYLLQVLILSHNDWCGLGPASAVNIRVGEEAGFRHIEEASRSREDWAHVFVDAGPCTIRDGRCRITLTQGGPEHWTVVKAFRFIPRAANGADPERRQQLEDLGYL